MIQNIKKKCKKRELIEQLEQLKWNDDGENNS